jgi:hypothetical protein
MSHPAATLMATSYGHDLSISLCFGLQLIAA